MKQTSLLMASFILLSYMAIGQSIRPERYLNMPGNTKVQYIQDKDEPQFFSDPIDDTSNFKQVVDNIYIDKAKKVYIRDVAFYPMKPDTQVYIEYFADQSQFLDVKTYKAIKGNLGYFANKGKVYMWWSDADHSFPIEVPGADPLTFVPFDSIAGGTDKDHVFYGGPPGDFKIIDGANPNKIKALNPDRGCWNCGICYFVDDKSVFFGFNKIPGADPKTFRLVNQGAIDAKDKLKSYYDGQPVQ